MLQNGVMYRRNRETPGHLFLHCDGARLLWNDILASQHLDWVLPRRMENVLKGMEEKVS